MSEEIAPTPKRNIFTVIFTSPNEPRLRAGWRLLLQTLLMIVIGGILEVAAYALKLPIGGKLGFFIGQILELLTFVSSIYIARRFLDRRSFSSLGFEFTRYTWPDILAGIGITFVMMGSIYLAEWSIG